MMSAYLPECSTWMSSGLVAFGPTEFSAKQNTACRFWVNPRWTAAQNAPRIAAAPPQSCFIPGIAVYTLNSVRLEAAYTVENMSNWIVNIIYRNVLLLLWCSILQCHIQCPCQPKRQSGSLPLEYERAPPKLGGLQQLFPHHKYPQILAIADLLLGWQLTTHPRFQQWFSPPYNKAHYTTLQ